MASSGPRRAGRLSIAVAALPVLMTTLFLVGAKPAGASTSSLRGQGSTTQFTCPPGALVPQVPATITFTPTKTKGSVTGFGFIFNTAPPVTVDLQFTGGTINSNSYSLTGFTNFTECSTFGPTAVPFKFTLSGQCGSGVVINYSDSAGETGDFVGNVVCR